ncbi:MAG: type II RES/Xre toxin-antitoxin system antitoxin [Longimicrobiales bacterium]
MTATGVAEWLGGERILKRAIRTDLDLVEAIESGLPIASIEAVIEEGILSADEIHHLVVPRRTLAHRKGRGQALTAKQSDRLTRVVRMAARAAEAISDPQKAARWLRKPNRTLQGKRPLDLLESDVGARMVEQLLGHIEHGLVA